MKRFAKLSARVAPILFFQTMIVFLGAALGWSVARYEVWELTLSYPVSGVTNPWEDVSVVATVTAPSRSFNIKGFYYDSPGVYKLRFAPMETGNHSYSVTLNGPSGSRSNSGSFNVAVSTYPGFLRVHPTNPYRLVFDDGSLFKGVGLGSCFSDWNPGITPFDNDMDFDGGDTCAGGTANSVSIDTYVNAYGQSGAGFNLVRWSVNNCAFNLWKKISTSGNVYLVAEGKLGDIIVQKFQGAGFRIWMDMFGWNPVFFDTTGLITSEKAAISRYVDYVVARYGAYVDIWEIMNERPAYPFSSFPRDKWNEWINYTASYLRSVDPYAHLITTSFERPDLDAIDLNTPHWYGAGSTEFNSDKLTSDIIAGLKSKYAVTGKKPILFGEMGNSLCNWDATSGLRWRLKIWTAFFEEAILVPWETSYIKNYCPSDNTCPKDNLTNTAANLYIGPEERGYVRKLQDFVADVSADIQRIDILPAADSGIRDYGLKSNNMILGYFHHFTNHTNAVNKTFTLTMPFSGAGKWIDPATGSDLGTFSVVSGAQSLTTPNFVVDIALKITAITPPTDLPPKKRPQQRIDSGISTGF